MIKQLIESSNGLTSKSVHVHHQKGNFPIPHESFLNHSTSMKRTTNVSQYGPAHFKQATLMSSHILDCSSRAECSQGKLSSIKDCDGSLMIAERAIAKQVAMVMNLAWGSLSNSEPVEEDAYKLSRAAV
jgi:hypothetical protein